jgi:hypothetical protein
MTSGGDPQQQALGLAAEKYDNFRQQTGEFAD